ncbi:hypothetical protein YC2023_019874 [Brassica napus]
MEKRVRRRFDGENLRNSQSHEISPRRRQTLAFSERREMNRVTRKPYFRRRQRGKEQPLSDRRNSDFAVVFREILSDMETHTGIHSHDKLLLHCLNHHIEAPFGGRSKARLKNNNDDLQVSRPPLFDKKKSRRLTSRENMLVLHLTGMYTNDDYCYELKKLLKCFIKCCINMRLPTFLFIKMRRRPLEFIIAYGISKDKKKDIEKKTSLEDFLEVVWKISWKSSSALYFRRLTGKSSQKSSRSEKPAYQIQISKPAYKKRSNDLKTDKMSSCGQEAYTWYCSYQDTNCVIISSNYSPKLDWIPLLTLVLVFKAIQKSKRWSTKNQIFRRCFGMETDHSIGPRQDCCFL